MNISRVETYQPTGYYTESVDEKVNSFKFKMQVIFATLKDQINDGNYTTAKLYTQMFLESIDLDKTTNDTVIQFYRVMDFIDRTLDNETLKGINKSKLFGIINTLMSSFE